MMRWKQTSGPAKLVTVLAALLILQIGVCFASPSEPPWFDKFFHVQRDPESLHIGLAVMQMYLCLITAVLLLIALLVWTTFRNHPIQSMRNDKPLDRKQARHTTREGKTPRKDPND
jgi:hypothetical protein